MSFQGLNERLRTAMILISIVIVCLLLGRWSRVGLALVVHAAICFEFYSFSLKKELRQFFPLLFASWILPVSFLFFDFWGFFVALGFHLLVTSFYLLLVTEREQHQTPAIERVAALYGGLGYAGLFGTALVIAVFSATIEQLVCVIAAVAFADTAAYFGGSAIGGEKLAPRISPKKTISGAIVGVIAASIVVVMLGFAFDTPRSPFYLAFVGVVIALLSIAGDLTESLFKRAFAVKDSGTLLPGHGGVLDRVDALLFAMPIIFLL